MAFTDSSSTRLAFIAEATENTIPATPPWQNLRFTGESLNYEKQTVTSDEIRPDRNVSDVIDVGYNVAGDVSFELSYGTFDAMIEGVLMSTWATDVIKNGVDPSTFAFEKTFEQGATDAFFRYTGCKVGSMSLSITAREIVTGSFTIMGMGHVTDTVIVTGATYTDATTTAVMSASADVGSMTIDGGSAKIMSIELNIENNLREQPVVGQKGLAGVGIGRCVVTGSLEAYFENLDLYTAFEDHEDVAIELTIGSVTTEKYTISIPRSKLSTGNITAGGNDADVMASFEFQAIFDATLDATIEITRAVA